MTVQLTSNDFRMLVSIVERDDNFCDVTGRIRLVSGALEGSPRANDILAQLNLDGTPRGVAVEVVRRLADFGRVAEDKEALGIFLNYLLFFKATEDQDAIFIRDLFGKYQLDRPMVVDCRIDDWHGNETHLSVREQIIGENTLRHIRILELALEAAKAVVLVNTPGGAGSGFMITPDLVMTNNHVIGLAEEATDSDFIFSYELSREGKPKQIMSASAQNGGLFYTNEELDYTILQLAGVPAFGVPLKLWPATVRRDDRVTIIQHPGGHYKKISMQNNFVAYADNRTIQYTTSTMPGSSGSPVFNDDFEVVAIHHSGGTLEEPTTQRHYLRNAGTSMIAVMQDIKDQAPDIYDRINVRIPSSHR